MLVSLLNIFFIFLRLFASLCGHLGEEKKGIIKLFVK